MRGESESTLKSCSDSTGVRGDKLFNEVAGFYCSADPCYVLLMNIYGGNRSLLASFIA